MSSNLKPPVSEKDHSEGADAAPITLVEFGDYQCPHCAAAHPIIKKMQDEFGNQLRFVFRHFPLSEMHPFAMSAAIATEAAALQHMFWEMHDVIFEHQSALNKPGLHKMAGTAGLDVATFENDIEQPSLKDKVEADFESGVRSGVNGTPSFFINGHKFDGGVHDLYHMLRENASPAKDS